MNIVSDFSCIFSKTPKNKQNKISFWRQSVSRSSSHCQDLWGKCHSRTWLEEGHNHLKPVYLNPSQHIPIYVIRKDILQCLFISSLFLKKEKGSPISSCPSWVVLLLFHGKRKGVIFFLLSKILSGSYCSVFIVCCFLSTAWLLPPV